MSRIQTPASIEAAPKESQQMLEAVKKKLGIVPNIFRMVSTSPASLEAHLSLSGALSKGKLDVATRERIALTVAELNGCSYCLSAHTYLGKNVAKLDDAEMAANRRGGSNDVKAAAAVRFAAKVVEVRGHVDSKDVEAVKQAGFDDEQILEIVFHVAMNTWTNYINEVGQTEIDFPVVKPSLR